MAGKRTHSGRNGTDYDHNGDTVVGGTASKVGFYGQVGVVKAAAPTAVNSSTVDTTYGQQEADVINSLRVTVNQLALVLKNLGITS